MVDIQQTKNNKTLWRQRTKYIKFIINLVGVIIAKQNQIYPSVPTVDYKLLALFTRYLKQIIRHVNFMKILIFEENAFIATSKLIFYFTIARELKLCN